MSETSQANRRILVVDDEPNLARSLAANLEKLGDQYIFDIANDGHKRWKFSKKLNTRWSSQII